MGNNVVANSDSTESSIIEVEVVYGTPTKQEIVTLHVKAGSKVEEVILQSGIDTVFPEIDLSVNKVGIWNRIAKLTDECQNLDRIEIYRPLIADPKEVRKRRAEKAKEEGRADKVTGGRIKPMRNK